MPIVILIIASLFVAVWLFLLGRADVEDWEMAAYSRVFDNCKLIDRIDAKEKEMLSKIELYKGVGSIGALPINRVRLFVSRNSAKRMEKLRKENESMQSGDLSKVNLFIIPGYVLQREFEGIGKGQIYKAVLKMNTELYGKKHAAKKTASVLAKLTSYTVIFVAASLLIGAIAMRVGGMMFGTAVLGVSVALVLVLIYAMYDDLNDRVKKRRALISKEFPNVVSKLALLVTSGMIMDKAWKLTANSRNHEVYREMWQTSEEMDNLVSPEAALNNFINRCNTKETAKLAGVIMQNLSKGNAHIGRLLKDMAHEAWLERQHKAKRDAEKANSKLMIPTMMLFLAILIMLMVPIIMSFSSL